MSIEIRHLWFDRFNTSRFLLPLRKSVGSYRSFSYLDPIGTHRFSFSSIAIAPDAGYDDGRYQDRAGNRQSDQDPKQPFRQNGRISSRIGRKIKGRNVNCGYVGRLGLVAGRIQPVNAEVHTAAIVGFRYAHRRDDVIHSSG